MKIQYCSDVHLEFELNSKFLLQHPLQVKGDILILAGDIVPLHDENFNHPFFTFVSANYRKVFWVPGNHELYYRDTSELNSSYRIVLKGNIEIVNNIELEYEGVRFVFSTLWSKISPLNQWVIEKNVADFECITNGNRKFTANDFNKLHDESLQFITQSLQKKKPKTVVVTHHLPSPLCNSPVHNNSPINEAFCVDLSGFIADSQANFWIYGHSHFNQAPVYIGETIMLTNQLGYVQRNEHGSFKQYAFFAL